MYKYRTAQLFLVRQKEKERETEKDRKFEINNKAKDFVLLLAMLV
jgi:hypothetical protein